MKKEDKTDKVLFWIAMTITIIGLSWALFLAIFGFGGYFD